jgi:hypothetical protein
MHTVIIQRLECARAILGTLQAVVMHLKWVVFKIRCFEQNNPRNIHSRLWNSPSVPASYSNECCNAAVYFNYVKYFIEICKI